MERENHPLPGFPSGDKPDSNFSLTPFYKPSLLGKSGAFSFTLSLRPSLRGENLCVSVGWGGASLEQVRECRKDTGSHPGKPPCEPFDFNVYFHTGGTIPARGRNRTCRAGLETVGGQRRLAPQSQWGAPRARTRRGGLKPPQGCGRRGPGRLRPARPARGARIPLGVGTVGSAQRRRQSWFAALGEAAPCETDWRDFRAPGRLSARLPGTLGCLSGVRVGDGGDCRKRLAVTAGPRAWAACRARRVRKRRTDSLNGGRLPRAASLGSPGSCPGHPRFPSQGPPRLSSHLPGYLPWSPRGLYACRRAPGWCPGVGVWARAKWSLGRLQTIIQ